MPEFCSCGVQLPPEARFCHKCGKPQFELIEPEALEAEQPPAPVVEPRLPEVPEYPAEISFRNAMAVRVGLFVAGLAFFLTSLAAVAGSAVIQFFLLALSTLGSGFFAVYLYHRRTGQFLTARSGAKLGFITGVFGFVISTVLFTISMMSIQSRGGLAELYRQQSSELGLPQETVTQVVEVLQNPVGLTVFILLLLLFQFVIGTTVASVGGALGAKVLEKE